MNSKQIWKALVENKVTKSFFDGIYPIDYLEDIIKKPKLIICNTDPSNKKGKHWVAFYFFENDVEFFDSLGNNISVYGKDFVNFAKRYADNCFLNKIRIQPENSDVCGEYCLYYAFYRCMGKNINSIIKQMSSISPKNILKEVEKLFYICENTECEFLQSCKKY